MIPFRNQFIEDAAKEAFKRKGKYQLRMKHPNTGEEVRMWFDTPPTKQIAADAYESLKGSHQQNSDSITKPYQKAAEKSAMSSKELAGETKRGTTVPEEYKAGTIIQTKNTVLAARGKISWAEAYKRDLPQISRRQTEDMILDEGTKQYEKGVDTLYSNPVVQGALGPIGRLTAPIQKELVKGLNPIPNRDPIQAYTNLVLEVALPALGVGAGKALKAILGRGAKSVDEIAEALVKDGVPEAEVAKIGVEWRKPKTIADVVDPELAAARKGMEGRQPRTAPVEVKPKAAPQAKEPKVATKTVDSGALTKEEQLEYDDLKYRSTAMDASKGYKPFAMTAKEKARFVELRAKEQGALWRNIKSNLSADEFRNLQEDLKLSSSRGGPERVRYNAARQVMQEASAESISPESFAAFKKQWEMSRTNKYDNLPDLLTDLDRGVVGKTKPPKAQPKATFTPKEDPNYDPGKPLDIVGMGKPKTIGEVVEPTERLKKSDISKNQPLSGEAVPQPKVKEPWQMTREEYVSSRPASSVKTINIDESHRGHHTAPMSDSGSPAWDVTKNGHYPDDAYGPNAINYYGTYISDAMDRETHNILLSIKGKQNARVQIYRAVPKSIKGTGDKVIQPGDWVTLTRAYAKMHGESNLGGDFRIVSREVRARDIFTNGDSWDEWGFDPQLPDPAYTHKVTVSKALRYGKPVPPEVLADYPDLDPNYDPGKPLDIVGMGKPKTIGEVVEPKVAPETKEPWEMTREEYRALDNAQDQYRVVQAAFERDGGSSMSAKELKAWGEARGFAPGHIETVGREFHIHRSRSIEALRQDIENNYKKEFDRISEGRNRGGSAGALNRDIDRITTSRLSLQNDLVYAVEKALSQGKRVSDEVIDEFLKYGGKLPDNVHPEIKAKYIPKAVPQPKVKEPIGTPKEPWQMTRSELVGPSQQNVSTVSATVVYPELVTKKGGAEVGARLSDAYPDNEAIIQAVKQAWAKYNEPDLKADRDFDGVRSRLKGFLDAVAKKGRGIDLYHKTAVARALSEGKRVPDNVVDEFLANGGKLPDNVHPEIRAKYASSKISTAAENARLELADAAKSLEKARKGTKRTKQSGSAYQPLNEAEIRYFKAWVKSKGLDAAEAVEEFVKHMADEFGDHADSIRWAVKNYLDETNVKAPSGANKADRVKQAESLGTPMPVEIGGKSLKQLEAQGKKDIAGGYDAPAEMARMAKDGLAANEREIAAFVAHRSTLLDELAGLNKRLDGNLTDEIREAVNVQHDDLMERIAEFDRNLDQIKGTSGRSLGAFRIGQTVNWSSLDEIKLEAKRRTGVELSEKQIKIIEKELNAQKELVKTRDARITELEAAKADAVVREVRRVPRKASIEQIRAERKQLFQDVKDILAEAKKNQVIGSGLGVFQSVMEASPELAKKIVEILKTYVDEFKFQTAKELSDQLLKDFPELGATEDDVRRTLAGMYDEHTSRPQSDWQKTRGESRKIENRASKLQEQEGILRTGITVARDKRVIQKSRELERLDLLIRANERHIQERLRAREQTVVQKIGSVVNAPRALAASIDLSAPGRQGWILSITNPKSAVAAFGKQMKAMTSRAESTAQFQKLLEHPKAVDAKKAGLYLADAESPMRHTEEAFLGNIFKWKKWNPIEASERAYNAYLNSVRMDAFDKLTKNITDPSDMKAIARYINVATGRGDLGHKAASAADFANIGMFSARYQASRVQYLIGQPLWSGGTAASKKLIAKEYGKFIGAMGTIMALAKLSGGVEVSTDPYSSDFMKIKIGDTRIDLWAGMQQWAVLGSRLAKGKYSTTTGRTFDLNEDRYGAKTSGDVAMRFVRSKLNPQAGAVWTTAEKKDYLGRPASVIGVATSFLPISPKELVEGMVEDGWDRSEAIGLLNFLGISVNTFDPAKPKDDRPTKN